MQQTFIDDFCFSDIINPLSPSPAKGLKRKKPSQRATPFNIASPSAKKARLDSEYKKLKAITKSDHTVSFSILLGHLGSRYYHNVDSNLEKLFSEIKKGRNPMDNKIFSIDKSRHIKKNLSQRDYDNLRSDLLPSVVLTSRSKLQAHTIGNLFCTLKPLYSKQVCWTLFVHYIE